MSVWPASLWSPTLLDRTPDERGLYSWEWSALVILAAICAAFGWLVIERSAHSELRMTDFGVYSRAAWAVRVGIDPYQISDDRGWHYCYPPPFVLFVTPLADPPGGSDRAGFLPFDVSVGLWYGLSLLLAAWAAHRFALAAAPDTVPWSRRWWYHRLIPFDMCLPVIGFTLSRGQVNHLVLALLAEMVLALRRRQPIAGGWWLAAAGALKVFPGLLILYPLAAKQWRPYLGVAAGLALLMGALPAAVWGVDGAIRMNRNFFELVATPGLTNTGDATRGTELTNTSDTDSQAFHAIVHNIRHSDRATRPTNSDGLSKAPHYLLGLGMIALTLYRARRIPALLDQPAEALLAFGGLCIIMVHLAPASHMHYYVYAMPTIAGLVALDLRDRPGAALPSWGLIAVLSAWSACIVIAMLDTSSVCIRLREVGLGVWPTVVLWGYSMSRLRSGQSGSRAQANFATARMS